MSLRQKTYYALLGVGSDADTATIDQAYRHLQKEYTSLGDGPDTRVRLQLLSEAHACLSDPIRRRVYDHQLANREDAPPLPKEPPAGNPALKPVALGLAALLTLGAGAWVLQQGSSAKNQPAAATQQSYYGATLVKSYSLPDEVIAAYNEALEKHRQPSGESLFALTRDWNGDEFTPAADSNPYKMVIKVSGKALAAGQVRTRWQPMWDNQGPLMGPQVFPDAKPGQWVQLESASPPVYFKSLKPTVPVLSLDEAENIEFSTITVEVWSGLGKNRWYEIGYAWSVLLVPVIFLGLKLWARRR